MEGKKILNHGDQEQQVCDGALADCLADRAANPKCPVLNRGGHDATETRFGLAAGETQIGNIDVAPNRPALECKTNAHTDGQPYVDGSKLPCEDKSIAHDMRGGVAKPDTSKLRALPPESLKCPNMVMHSSTKDAGTFLDVGNSVLPQATLPVFESAKEVRPSGRTGDQTNPTMPLCIEWRTPNCDFNVQDVQESKEQCRIPAQKDKATMAGQEMADTVAELELSNDSGLQSATENLTGSAGRKAKVDSEPIACVDNMISVKYTNNTSRSKHNTDILGKACEASSHETPPASSNMAFKTPSVMSEQMHGKTDASSQEGGQHKFSPASNSLPQQAGGSDSGSQSRQALASHAFQHSARTEEPDPFGIILENFNSLPKRPIDILKPGCSSTTTSQGA
jgi:hypothetical protein